MEGIIQTSFTDWAGEERLQHYGVLGMKWGQRRFQNEDGSLTAAGQKRYRETGEYGYTYKSHGTKKYEKKAAKAGDQAKAYTAGMMAAANNGHRKAYNKFKQKATKLAEKKAKYEQRADISRQLDKREQDYAKSVKAGGNIALRILTDGMMGGKPYQQHLAMNSQKRTTGSKVASAVLTYIGGRPLSTLRKAAVMRSNENTLLGSLGRNVGGDTVNYRNKNKYGA